MFWYVYGYTTYHKAEMAMIDLFASGEIDLSDWPTIARYTNKAGETRYGIQLKG